MGLVESNPHKYAFAILRNKIGDAQRSHQKRRENPLQVDQRHDSSLEVPLNKLVINPTGAEDDALAELERKDLTDHVREAIKKLPLFCRTFFLAILEGRSIKELWRLSKELEPGLRRSAFDKRIFDCRRKLKELMEDQI